MAQDRVSCAAGAPNRQVGAGRGAGLRGRGRRWGRRLLLQLRAPRAHGGGAGQAVELGAQAIPGQEARESKKSGVKQYDSTKLTLAISLAGER